MIESPQIAVVYPTCDKYLDVVTIALAFLGKYWPDCPWPIYVGTNTKPCAYPGVTAALAGPDRDWSTTLRRQLEQIPCEYILSSDSDMYLARRVDTAALSRLLVRLRELDGGCIRLRPAPPPDVGLGGDPAIGEILPGAEYRCSFQPTIWRRTTLLRTLRDGETGWQWEIEGSLRTKGDREKFYSTYDWLFHYCDFNPVTRGKWHPKMRGFLKRHQIEGDLGQRVTMTQWEVLQGAFARCLSYVPAIRRIPPTPRRAAADLLRTLRLLPARWDIATPIGEEVYRNPGN